MIIQPNGQVHVLIHAETEQETSRSRLGHPVPVTVSLPPATQRVRSGQWAAGSTSHPAPARNLQAALYPSPNQARLLSTLNLQTTCLGMTPCPVGIYRVDIARQHGLGLQGSSVKDQGSSKLKETSLTTHTQLWPVCTNCISECVRMYNKWHYVCE